MSGFSHPAGSTDGKEASNFAFVGTALANAQGQGLNGHGK